LPPFQGGAAGLLAYDLGRSVERVPRPQYDEFQLPAMAVGLYDTVLAIDHVDHRAWLISQGFPETEPTLRVRRAERRIDQFRELLAGPVARKSPVVKASAVLAPQFPVPGPVGLTSNFSAAGYLAAVQRAVTPRGIKIQANPGRSRGRLSLSSPKRSVQST